MQPLPELGPGSVLGGDFRVVSPLSSGGMGAVYVAEQVSTGKRRALKVMHPGLVQDASLRDRFVQEARVGSMIPSDHVVQVVAAGIDAASGAPWIAMELLDGENLAEYVARRGPLLPQELGTILAQLCHALGAAHQSGVVHRDIKPENVFLARTQSTTAPMSVKVLDFGIAKVAAQLHATATAVLGTPLWMAPEQSEALGRITPATDVWALGLLAYFALTGQNYWRSANLAAGSIPALMREILFEPIVLPSERAREGGVAERIPPGFDAWFLRAVSRDPAARYPDANALYADYVALLAGRELASAPTSALPSAPVHSLQPPPKRGGSLASWLGLGIGTVLLIGVIGASIGAYLLYFQDASPRASASVAASIAPAPAATTSATGGPTLPSSSSAYASPTGPKPVDAKSVVKPAASAEPAKKPFDSAKASQTVNTHVETAKFSCKNMDGPAVVSGSVNFRNDGHSTVFVDIATSTTARGNCVRGTMAACMVPPFDGPSQSMPFTVGF